MIELVGGDGGLEKGPMTAQPNQNSLAEPSPSPSPSSTTSAPALVLSNSGKRMDQAGKKKYLKQVTGRHNDTELHLAAQRADLAAVKKILGDIDSQIVGTVSGAEFDTEVAEVRAAVVNEVNELGETALFTAADKGHLDVVKELLKYSNRETVTKKNRSGFDPLHAAASQGHHAIVQVLLDHDPGLSKTIGPSNSTPLISAAHKGHIAVVDELLSKDSTLLEISKSNGKNALHLAARQGHTEIVSALLCRSPVIRPHFHFISYISYLPLSPSLSLSLSFSLSLSLSLASLMAATDLMVKVNSSQVCRDHPPPKLTTIKKLIAESQDTNGNFIVPPTYTYTNNNNPHDDQKAFEEDTEAAIIPTVDLSLLTTSATPEQRSKAINDLGKACQDWGFFMVINHGVPESLMKAILDGCEGFFDLTEEEKQEFEGKHVLDPIRCGTSFNASVENVRFWRDFLKVFVYPEFHFPSKPAGFSELASEYCKRTREVTRELLKGISESLGLEATDFDTALDVESAGLQIFIANLYPPCPQPELAMGMPPHSDHGLLTLLMQNGISGLQVQHKGKWVNVNAAPYSFLVNTGDHLEIFSNGKYRSNIHRAVLNNKSTRISVATPTGPSLETVVRPAPKLVDTAQHPAAAYIGMKYKDYLELQQGNVLDGKSILDRVRAGVSNSE